MSLPPTDFSPRGYTRRKAVAKYRATHPEQLKARQKAWIARNTELVMLAAARRRAKIQGLEFALTRADIVIPATCPVLGIPLVPNRDGVRGTRAPGSPSLDRIDSSKGYVPGNVWVISWRANDLKGDGTIQEFEALLSAWRRVA